MKSFGRNIYYGFRSYSTKKKSIENYEQLIVVPLNTP